MHNIPKILLIPAVLIICFIIQTATADASLTTSESVQIDDMVKEQMDNSKIPDIAIAVIKNDSISYLSYSNSNLSKTVNEHSLFQIGSLSKAFTALGILLLEDEGLLAVDAPVSRYIPWFSVQYQGKEVDPEDLTIADLLYQTSGFLNDESKYPRALEDMTLEENIKQTNGCDLAFYPSQQYSYANTNYYLLGYIIELLSEQNYQDFMYDRIFAPLDLHHTYASPAYVTDKNSLISGNRLSFFKAYPYDVPIIQGNVPAGYIITDISDLSRWLQIQMGQIKTSEQFTRIIAKSHKPNPNNPVNSDTQYASGWFVNEQENNIYHSGGTPNFSSNISFYPDRNIGVCVLSNMNASVNTNTIGQNILHILEGKQLTPCKNDIWTTLDSIFSILSLISSIGIITLIALFLRLVKHIKSGICQKYPGKKPLFGLLLPVLFLLLTICNFILLPLIFAADWSALLIWGPPSIPTGSILLFLFILSLVSASYRSK